jgi:hypothetical protein
MAATMIKAHKIRLNPTPEQEEYLRRAAGTRRFVYNWGLAEWNKQYAAYKEGKRDKKPKIQEQVQARTGQGQHGCSAALRGSQSEPKAGQTAE